MYEFLAVFASREACTTALLCDCSKLIQMKLYVNVSLLLLLFLLIFFLLVSLLPILPRILLLLRYYLITKETLFPPIFAAQQAPIALLAFPFLWLLLQLAPRQQLWQLLWRLWRLPLPLPPLQLFFFPLLRFIRAFDVYFLRATQSDLALSHGQL